MGKNYNIQISKKNSDGTIDELNPITKAKNVKISVGNNIPSSASSIQDVVNSLGSIAFSDGSTMVYLTDSPNDTYDPAVTNEIADNITSSGNTWSSAKISEEIYNATHVPTMVYISETPDGEDSAYDAAI